ncbi:hypothetical protein [Pseudarthrobacter albicanus]|uniref:hypothetical protein n=1 Tax=Pseudarthrobacter albicanus TaxID=2823873 RepID=UPI001BAC1CDD|nr:hypothetical protein [Pseudarthrobacter albicanus]
MVDALNAQRIRDLIRYAVEMAEYMQAEIDHANAEGRGFSVLDLPAVVEGWKFTALARRESYDGGF